MSKDTPAPSPARMTAERRAVIEAGNEGRWDTYSDRDKFSYAVDELLDELAAVEAERDRWEGVYRVVTGERDHWLQERAAMQARLPTPEMVRAAAIPIQLLVHVKGVPDMNEEREKITAFIAAALKVDMSPAAPTKETES